MIVGVDAHIVQPDTVFRADVGIPKEIRHTRPSREGNPSYTTFTSFDFFIRGIVNFAQRITGE